VNILAGWLGGSWNMVVLVGFLYQCICIFSSGQVFCPGIGCSVPEVIPDKTPVKN
jgi:hypothetical protein